MGKREKKKREHKRQENKWVEKGYRGRDSWQLSLNWSCGISSFFFVFLWLYFQFPFYPITLLYFTKTNKQRHVCVCMFCWVVCVFLCFLRFFFWSSSYLPCFRTLEPVFSILSSSGVFGFFRGKKMEPKFFFLEARPGEKGTVYVKKKKNRERGEDVF